MRSCRLEVGFSFFALLAFCCLFLGGESSVFFLAAAAFHELGHVGALWGLGAPPAVVTLSALGCRIVPSKQKTLSYRQTAFVSWAGPAANLLLAGILFAAGRENHPFFTANLVLGGLHSLPIEPLDGGMALHALLRSCLSNRRAAQLSCAVGIALLLPLAAMGFLVLLRTRYNFTLLAMSVYLMLYLVLGRDLSL